MTNTISKYPANIKKELKVDSCQFNLFSAHARRL